MTDFELNLQAAFYSDGIAANVLKQDENSAQELLAGFVAALFVLLEGREVAALSQTQLRVLVSKFNKSVKKDLTDFSVQTDTKLETLFKSLDIFWLKFLTGMAGKKLTRREPVTWQQSKDRYIGAGIRAVDVLDRFTTSIAFNLQQAVVTANTTGLKNSELRANIFALGGRFKAGTRAALVTLSTFARSIISWGIGGELFTHFQWQSIIDERTTPFCLDRHMQIFPATETVLPPAHYYCRSSIYWLNLSDKPAQKNYSRAEYSDMLANDAVFRKDYDAGGKRATSNITPTELANNLLSKRNTENA